MRSYITYNLITNVSNSILNYMEICELSSKMKNKIVQIIDNNCEFDDKNIILYSVECVVKLLNKKRFN